MKTPPIARLKHPDNCDPMLWDVFCRVVDNHGDAGVAWRFASDLASRGEQVRLWIDDLSALAGMAPAGEPGVTMGGWHAAAAAEPGAVVVETFGCDLPALFLAAMAARPKPPLWIDLEYLSAEPYVERSHGLASPQTTGPGAGLCRWFWFPGYTARTGGLIREPGLATRRQAFDVPAWLASRGLATTGERIVSLFCYEQPALPALLERLAAEPTLLLATPGHAARQVRELLGPALRRGRLRAIALPWLSQADYDHLLWASDLNFVRGEDSFVRAQWAGRPFVWQIYRQDDDAHLAKLEAFMALSNTAPDVAALWRAWNGSAALPMLPAAARWSAACRRWREQLLALPDLTSRLLDFVAGKS